MLAQKVVIPATAMVALLGSVVWFCGCEKPVQPAAPAKTAAVASKPAAVPPFPMDSALAGKLEDVTAAIRNGANVNEADEDGQTPLMMAAFNGHLETVKALVRAGARVNARNLKGRAPLTYAASGPFPDTVEYLLASGAEIDAQDPLDQWTALMTAAAEGQTDVVRVLLEHQANAALVDKDKHSAEDFARLKDHPETADLIHRSLNPK